MGKEGTYLDSFKVFLETVALQYLIRIVVALLILWIGLKVIKVIVKGIKKVFDKSNTMDPTVEKFLLSFITIFLKVVLIISVITLVGIPTTSFIAILGALSLAIGMAFQGSLSNFAGGILLLVLRPIKVGDFIDVSGSMGTVEVINIFSTELITVDNKKVIIPNALVSNATIVNYSVMDNRRVDLNFGVSYDSDIDHVKRVILEEINKLPQVQNSPEPFVALSEQADSALIFVVRVWTQKAEYWNVHFALLENMKKAFDREGIDIPYNVLDVRLPEKNA